MDILLIGSGGREHAICRGLRKSKQVETIYCAPGNPGMAQIAECVALPSDNESIADFAEKKKVGLVVIGPEAPLCQGVADAVRARGIPVFGPSGAAISTAVSSAAASHSSAVPNWTASTTPKS